MYTKCPSSRKRIAMKTVTFLLPLIVLIDMVGACEETECVVSRSGKLKVTDQGTLSRINLIVSMECQVESYSIYGPFCETGFPGGKISTIRIQHYAIKDPVGVYINDTMVEDDFSANCSNALRCSNTHIHLVTLYDVFGFIGGGYSPTSLCLSLVRSEPILLTICMVSRIEDVNSSSILGDCPMNAQYDDIRTASLPRKWYPAHTRSSRGAVLVIHSFITHLSSNLQRPHRIFSFVVFPLSKCHHGHRRFSDQGLMNQDATRTYIPYCFDVCSFMCNVLRDYHSVNHTDNLTNWQRPFAELSKQLYEAITVTDVCQRLSTARTMINVCVMHVIMLLAEFTVCRHQDQDNFSVQYAKKKAEFCVIVNSFGCHIGVEISGTCRMPNTTEKLKCHGHSPVPDADGNPKNRVWKNIMTYQLKVYHTKSHKCLHLLLTFVFVFVVLSYLSYPGNKDAFQMHGKCEPDQKSQNFDSNGTHVCNQPRVYTIRKWYLDYRSDIFHQIYQDPVLVYPVHGVASSEDFFRQLLLESPLKVQEHMRFEWARLKSFKSWPDWAHGFPSQMARAGFYYTQDADKVVCFSCGAAVLDWTPSMVPMDEHKIRFPCCKFVLGQNSDNRPISEGTPATSSSDPFFILKDSMPAGSSDSNSGVHLPAERSGAHEISERYTTCTSVPVSDSGCVSTPLSHLAAVDSAQPSTFVERMKIESSRRSTFRSWPKPEAVSVLDLVKAGLYYTGNRDEVKCAFCRGVLGSFQPGDNPMSKHRSLFPGCSFVRGSDSSNLELYPSLRGTLEAGTDESVPRSTPHSELVSELQNLSILDDMSQLAVHSAKPKHPEYALVQSRVDSFHAWSSTHEQSPRDLAVAGFIYAGMGDCVKCFYCDGGLRNWLPGDLPWAEHARWFPNCLYVKLCKGQEFIDTVEQRYPRLPVQPGLRQNIETFCNSEMWDTKNTNTLERSKVSESSSISTVGLQRAAATATITSSTTELLHNLLTSPSAQSAMHMGYSTGFIKKGLGKYLLDYSGTGHALTAQTLMEILFEMEDNGEAESNTAESGDDVALSLPVKSEKKTTTLVDVSPLRDGLDSKSLRDKNRELIEQTLCKICLEKKMCITFLPCGHLVTCELCAPALRKCPICRSTIKGHVRVYMS